MEPQSHPRAGTSETTNKNKDKSANGKTEGSQVILSRMEENKKREHQPVIEHPGGRNETEKGNVNSNHDNNRKGQESTKVKATNDTEMVMADKEPMKSNQKTSKSCILI